MSKVQADFDRIARLSTDSWDHNSHYHRFLLRRVPLHCADALDIGCGTGGFARQLAARSKHVLAVDLSPEMVRVARERSRQIPNVELLVADALEVELAGAQYDCIASIATLHHLPFEEMLCKMKRALRPNGVLLVLDLVQPEGRADMLRGGLALSVSTLLGLLKTHRLRESAELRAAWADHGRSDQYLTLAQVRDACARLLSGAQVRRHLLWRYSIVWRAKAPAGIR
jgi:ubiquinone/menaquinone biosynthesis C-methylase UbiE